MIRERALVAAAFAVLGLLRLATLAPDPWEWDEVLFMEGVRDGLDVRVNHPHAPGYPVFIRLGQSILALGVEPFRATTVAGALGGWLSCLALYLLLRELGSRRGWALAGALLYALTPSVWLHGVRPLSDGPGAAAALFAAFFLARAISGRGRHALVLAALCTALAAGVRPQVGLALLPAASYAAFRVWRRERSLRPLVLAVAAALVLSAAIWLPAFRSSGGFATWKARFDAQMAWVTANDSPKLRDVLSPPFWKRWWLDPIGQGKLATAFLLLGLAGAAAAPRKAAAVFIFFAPVTALTLGVLSTDSAPRYVLAFWAVPCALAVFALERAEAARGGRLAARAAGLAFLGAFAALGVPPIVEVATKRSPSVGAMRAVLAMGVASGDVFVAGPLRAHADEFFQYRARVVADRIPAWVPPGGAVVGAEDRPFGLSPQRVFTLDHPRLLHISRGRYLRTEVFTGREGAGIFVPVVFGPGNEAEGTVTLGEGARLAVLSAAEADVSFSMAAADGAAAVDVAPGPDGPRRRIDLTDGRAEATSFRAAPDASERLFTVKAIRGRAVLDAFLIRARAPAGAAALRVDDGIPASVDEPAEGDRVPPTFTARGWCQERGGGRVHPIEFRIDGLLVPDVPVTRIPRPDVAAAVPAIGDARAAGWVAQLSPGVEPGRHVLTVTFQAGDRRRVYPPRGIEIVAPGGAK